MGVVTRVVDQSLFAEVIAPGCHGATWKDTEGQVLSGIPLWSLAGYVDDEKTPMKIDTALWASRVRHSGNFFRWFHGRIYLCRN